MSRQIVRQTATKVLRSDDLTAGERETAAEIVRTTPGLGNPHRVRCDWCHETQTLFRDESEVPFKLTDRGWHCEKCDARASSQLIRL